MAAANATATADTKTVATVEPVAPMATIQPGLGAFGIEGLEGVGQQDIILPRWSVVQPTSKFEGADEHVGYFRKNLDGSYVKELDVVVLTVDASRILWSGDLQDKQPECVSRDTVHGSLPRNEHGMYGACASCAFNPQHNRELMEQRQSGQQVKACGYGYNMLVASAEEPHAPALFGVMGTSVRPIKTLISQFAERRTSPFSAIVRFTTEKQTNDRGKFYVLTPTVIRWFTDPRNPDRASFDTFRALYLQYKGATVRDIEEDDADVAAGDDPAPFA
jgi:hypothetical protein